jgi:hypothetical protein
MLTISKMFVLTETSLTDIDVKRVAKQVFHNVARETNDDSYSVDKSL